MAQDFSSVNVTQVYDPRMSVHNTIVGPDGKINYLVERVSPAVSYWQQYADTTSQGQLAWNGVNIDKNTGVSQLIYITTPVRITLNAAEGSTGNLYVPGGGAPRSSLFMKNDASVNLLLNSTNLSESTRYYLHALSHYGYNYDSLINRFSNTLRSCLDNNVNYVIGANNCVLGQYNDASVMNGVMARGSYEGVYFIVQPSETPTTQQIIDVLYTDIIPVSPLNISDETKYCIPGIYTLGLQVNMNPQLKYLWSYSPDSGAIIDETTSTVVVGDPNCAFGTQATLFYQTYKIPLELTGGIPASMRDYIYPCYWTDNFQAQGVPISAGATAVLNTRTITPQGIPKYVYVWAEMADADRNATDPYWFLQPQSIVVNFLNNQTTLSGITLTTGQPVNTQLYNLICAKNGCKDSIVQWGFHTPVVCISCEDLQLDPTEVAGMIQTSSLTIQYTVRNQSTSSVNAIVYMTLVYEGCVLYDGKTGVFTKYGNIVSQKFLTEAKTFENRYYYLDRANSDYLGGFSLSSIANAAKDATKKVISGVQKAAPYVKSGINAAEKYGPAALAILGAGSGGGFVGGEHLSREKLRKRLSKY